MDEVLGQLNPWWERRAFDVGIPRRVYLERLATVFARRQIHVILGSRRVGKTVFLKQLVNQCLQRGVEPTTIFYAALDHPRLSALPLTEHLRAFRRRFRHPRDRRLYLFLDEVQASPQWEVELKAIYDTESVKIVCTGSTAALLERQRGRLTGRQLITTMYPLTFEEYVEFKNIHPSQAEGYLYERALEDYLTCGGYPEHVLEPSEDYLHNLLEDILARDIIKIHPIHRPDVLRDLLSLLAGSVGSRTSFHKLANTLGLTIETIKTYIGYLQSAFLVRALEKWSPSQADKIYAPKKFYLYDMGIKSLLSGPGDLGAKIENLVFLHLMQEGLSCGYYAESERELDFACGPFTTPRAVEAKYLSRLEWEDKRLAGVKLFLKRYPAAKHVTVVSKDAEARWRKGHVTVELIPAWTFLTRKYSSNKSA
jgi:predicted AAA+ superfamily ATPase